MRPYFKERSDILVNNLLQYSVIDFINICHLSFFERFGEDFTLYFKKSGLPFVYLMWNRQYHERQDVLQDFFDRNIMSFLFIHYLEQSSYHLFVHSFLFLVDQII